MSFLMNLSWGNRKITTVCAAMFMMTSD